MILGFLGEYDYKIDEKGRVAIPPKFREEFKEGGVLTRGWENCIRAYPLPEWKKMEEKLIALPETRSKSRRMARFVFGKAFDFELDRQGRLALPPPLRQYGEIRDTVIIVGVNNCLEFWSKENWSSEESLIEEQAWQIAESLDFRP